MVKFTYDCPDGTQVIGLGITEETIARLKGGQPIQVKGQTINIPTMNIVLFYGKDEMALYEMTKRHIGDKTMVQIDGKP